MFYKAGVDLQFWAHEHSYERLWPIYNFTVSTFLSYIWAKKTGRKIFVIVIPKEGLAGRSPAKLSFEIAS